MRGQHTLRAAAPAAVRALLFSAVVTAGLAAGAAWVTDGFTKLDWKNLRSWAFIANGAKEFSESRVVETSPHLEADGHVRAAAAPVVPTADVVFYPARFAGFPGHVGK